MIGLGLQTLPDVAAKPTAWLRALPQYVLPTLHTLQLGQDAASLFAPPTLPRGTVLDTTLELEADHAGLVLLLSSLLGGVPDAEGKLKPQTRNFAPELPLLPLSLEAQAGRWQAEGALDVDPDAIPLHWQAWDGQVSELGLTVGTRQTVRVSARVQARRSGELLTGLTPPRDVSIPAEAYLFKHHFLQLEVAGRWETLKPESGSLKLTAPLERLTLDGVATLDTLGYYRTGPLSVGGEFTLHGPQRDLLRRHHSQEPLQLVWGLRDGPRELRLACWVQLREVAPERVRVGEGQTAVQWQAVSLDETGLLEVWATSSA